MLRNRALIITIAALAITCVAGLQAPALAEIGDIVVGGVWVCRLTRGAAGLTLDQRIREVERRITDVLSLPELKRRLIDVEVRPVGAAAAIVAAGITILTVTPEDTAGMKVPTYQWLASGPAAWRKDCGMRSRAGRSLRECTLSLPPLLPRIRDCSLESPGTGGAPS